MKNKQEHLEGENEALSEALAPIVNRLIDKNYETSKDKIASQMAPLIGGAIREQIKHQKDDVVDALYPVMGNMISRYVSKSLEEMLETINQKIQSGLSIDTIKRKIKAKVKGMSETELLLQESSSTQIKAILLIHKETGIVLTQAHALDSAIDEPEMVASMMTAIRSFINDWVEKNEKNSEVGEIDYGGSKIVIENSGYSYLAVIVDGATYNKTYDRIRQVLENIIVEYGDDIRNFNGDFENFPIEKIKDKFSPLLNIQQQETTKDAKKMHPLIFLIPILLVVFLSWKYYENYLDKNLIENVNTTLYKTPQLTIYRIEAISKDNKIVLKGEVPANYYKTLATEVIKKLKTKRTIDNQLIVIKHIDTPDEIDSKILYTINSLNTQKCLNLKYKYEHPKLILLGDSCDIKHKNIAIDLIKSNANIKDIQDKIKIIHPDINTTIYYKRASYDIDENQKLKLLQLSKKLKNLDKNITIIITGYSDDKGTLKSRKKVSKQRALSVANILKNNFLIEQKIKIVANGESPKNIDVNKSPNKARCSIITSEF